MAEKTRVYNPDRVKHAIMNLTGRDNRTPFMGNTQFPTEGSKTKSEQLGQAGKNKAEVGPAPLMGKLDKTKMHTLQDTAVSMPSAIGSLPKIGAAMNTISDENGLLKLAYGGDPRILAEAYRKGIARQGGYVTNQTGTYRLGAAGTLPQLVDQGSLPANVQRNMRTGAVASQPKPPGMPKVGFDRSLQDDPLVQYVQKHAEALMDNISKMDLGEKEQTMLAEPVDFSSSQAERKRKEDDELLKSLFVHYPVES